MENGKRMRNDVLRAVRLVESRREKKHDHERTNKQTNNTTPSLCTSPLLSSPPTTQQQSLPKQNRPQTASPPISPDQTCWKCWWQVSYSCIHSSRIPFRTTLRKSQLMTGKHRTEHIEHLQIAINIGTLIGECEIRFRAGKIPGEARGTGDEMKRSDQVLLYLGEAHFRAARSNLVWEVQPLLMAGQILEG